MNLPRANRALAIATLLFTFRLSAPAQSTVYALEGGMFRPVGGEPFALTGTFEWAAPVLVYDPNFGQQIATWDAIALDFRTTQLTFRLDESPLNDCVSRAVPSPTAVLLAFCERVNVFDPSGSLVESGLYITTGMTFGIPGPTRHEFPHLEVYRNYNSDQPELVGEMSFSAVAVPEPSVWTIASLGVFALAVILRPRAAVGPKTKELPNNPPRAPSSASSDPQLEAA